MLGAEIDKMSPPELVKQFEQVLTAKPGVVFSFFCGYYYHHFILPLCFADDIILDVVHA